MSDEIIDIVNEHDEVVGAKPRSEIYKEKLTCFRVINAFMMNNEGKIWIPRRHPSKQLMPNVLDASVGGHVLSGEDYLEAFFRETHEELGLKKEQYRYTILDRLIPHEHKTTAFMYVYLIYYNQEPPYNKNDFSEAYWLYPQKARETIEQGEPSKSDLSILLQTLITWLKR